MQHAVRKLAGLVKAHRTVCFNLTSVDQSIIQDTPCTDIFISSKGFLGKNLDVTQYYGLVREARYSLVPCGVNPESYRLWESLHSGSIPIIELCGSPWEHPLKAMPGALQIFPTIWDWWVSSPTTTLFLLHYT